MTDSIQNALMVLLDKGEWKIIIISIILAFAITYVIKIFYFSFVKKDFVSKNHIRLIAILSGFISSSFYWPINAISLNWYQAGFLIGPLSIFVYHIALGIASMKAINKKYPFIRKIIKGSIK